MERESEEKRQETVKDEEKHTINCTVQNTPHNPSYKCFCLGMILGYTVLLEIKVKKNKMLFRHVVIVFEQVTFI